MNLAQHSYFNLHGHDGPGQLPPVDDHEVVLGAARYTPVDGNLIPTGELASVAGTPFDLTAPAALGPRLRTFEVHQDSPTRTAHTHRHTPRCCRPGSGPAAGPPLMALERCRCCPRCPCAGRGGRRGRRRA